jgi:hypothetical protein
VSSDRGKFEVRSRCVRVEMRNSAVRSSWSRIPLQPYCFKN